MSKWNLSSKALVTTMAITCPAFAETQLMSAAEAYEAVRKGDMLLLDIRSEEEWRETGLADGALPVSMHSREFGRNLQRLMQKFEDKPIAMICATGGRTAYVASVLKENGLDVIDVSEGMMGNRRGNGWLKSGLPVVDLTTAQQVYDSLLASE